MNVAGNVFNNGGLVSLGAETYKVNGSFTQSSGSMTLNAVGAPFVQSGELIVTGDAFLGGTLNIDFVRTLAVGETYKLVKADGNLTISGLSFAFQGVPDGFGYTTLDSGGVLSLTVSACPSRRPLPWPHWPGRRGLGTLQKPHEA